MTTVVPTVPDRSALRVLYDAAVAEINTARNNNLLTTDFYAKTGDAVFNAGHLALKDTVTDTRRMHVVSSPAGAGKTSFSYALIAALTRYAEATQNTPYGSVFVVDRIEKAEEVFCELSALLPGKVAIWTTDHDLHCKEPEKITEPAAQFTQEELKRFPVIVVTHNFYLKSRGYHARNVLRQGVICQRALTIVDEKPDEAPTLEITLAEAQRVREALSKTHPEIKEQLDALFLFMEQYSYAPSNKLYRPGVEIAYAKLVEELGWFRSADAERLAKSASNIPGIETLFAFAKALVIGRACVATSGSLPHFFGYQEQRVTDRTAGAILLDATADIDGISSIVPWRLETETPKARYDNLEIVHVRQHTKTRLSEYLDTAPNRRAYVQWMVETIRQHMKPGERGLVICKKRLFKDECVPQWNEGDPRFKDTKSFTENYGWDVEGRKLCATHWGTGVGSNAWRDAAVVFLFDEFFAPRRVSVATTQSYRGHRTDQGDLGSMRTLNSKARGVDSIADGHTLRWTKQLALRGRARLYDEQGVCGKQRLVVGSDLRRFMTNASKLFPGAKMTTAYDLSDNTTWATKILTILSNTQERVLTTKALSGHLGKPWKNLSTNVLTNDFLSSLEGLGWRYVKLRGCRGARFERLVTYPPLEAPSVQPLCSNGEVMGVVTQPGLQEGVLSGMR